MECELDLSGSGQELVVGSCEHGNETSSQVKAEKLSLAIIWFSRTALVRGR
jgi:hypothetical protein